jgi:pre-mRNA cleavage complex 2 protein Pcf11
VPPILFFVGLQKDGSLLLKQALRDEMQSILDDLQSDVQDELEKVSLERLSSLNPDLLSQIKQTAEESIKGGKRGTTSGTTPALQSHQSDALDFLIETRTLGTIARSQAWEKLDLQHLKETHDLIASLQHLVRDGSTSSETRYTQSEALDMTSALATAASTATILTNALNAIKEQEDKTKSKKSSSTTFSGSDKRGAAVATSRGYLLSVDKSLFTSEGIKNKIDAVIGILYEVGLPFVSSADGRRFATQQDLSDHLDTLFKKGYVWILCSCFNGKS